MLEAMRIAPTTRSTIARRGICTSHEITTRVRCREAVVEAEMAGTNKDTTTPTLALSKLRSLVRVEDAVEVSRQEACWILLEGVITTTQELNSNIQHPTTITLNPRTLTKVPCRTTPISLDIIRVVGMQTAPTHLRIMEVTHVVVANAKHPNLWRSKR